MYKIAITGFFGLLCLLIADKTIAQKHDNVWVGGFDEFNQVPGADNYLLRFDNGVPQVLPADLGINFESTMATFSDSSGQLVFVSNGCAITMGDGTPLVDNYMEDLNGGEVRDMVCDATGYISPRGGMFLPVPGKEKNFCHFLHMGMNYSADRRLTYGPFYTTIVSTLGFNGIGQVVEKNRVLLDVSLNVQVFIQKTYEPFSVVRHGNGRDWWIIVPEYRRNKYHVLLVSPNFYIEEKSVQEIGPEMKCRRIGSSTFSKDGSKYARQQNCGVTVMDFNRCTGKFSNPLWLSLPGSTFPGGSVAISPDNSTIITNSYLNIYKANLSDAIPAFDTLNFQPPLTGITLNYFQEGPDGNLYFSSPQRETVMPVLRDPFSISPEYDVQSVLLPVPSVRSLPHFPNYRLYDFADSPCDTLGINTPVSAPELIKDTPAFMVYPNPASDKLNIRITNSNWSGNKEYFIRITNLLGKETLLQPFYADNYDINTTRWPVGVYFVTLLQGNNILRTQKVIIQK